MATARPAKSKAASAAPTAPLGQVDLDTVADLLAEFEKLETQLHQVREGLTHSHRLATLGTIATIIAHEFNNILTPMMSYGQLALARPNDHDLMRKAVEKAVSGSERAAKICSSLLGFSREADEHHVAPLMRTIDETIACLSRDPKKDGIDLTIDVPDVQVAISPLNLQQVLLNLILNAKKAMGIRGGRLRITAKIEGSMVHIDVADNGPGIPPAIRDRLFEPFVTLKNHPDRDDGLERKGTGLGLCICRDLVRNAGGNITVDSVPDQGATFHICLPKADDLFEST